MMMTRLIRITGSMRSSRRLMTLTCLTTFTLTMERRGRKTGSRRRHSKVE